MLYDLEDAPDLVTLMRQHAATRPGAEALVFLADPDDVYGGAVRCTFEELDRQARACAAWLQERLPEGSRVLLLHPNGIEWVAAYFGCLYAGMIAVPAPQPGRQRHQRSRIATVAGSADAAAVLTDAADLPEVLKWAEETGLDGVLVAANGTPGFGDPQAWRPVPLTRDTIALLQYTSGSTGDPKGVVVRHGNMLHNLDALTADVGWTASLRVGGWLPLYHDMGLVTMLLAAILRGGTTVMMTPSAFIRSPVRWLRAMDAHGINVAFAPSFAYDLCVNRISDEEVASLDLSGWRIAGNASEPVDRTVLDRFAAKFAPAGFRAESFAPAYGLAEATAYVSGTSGRSAVVRRINIGQLAEGRFAEGGPGETRDVVSCGPPTRACEIRVVDPASREPVEDGRLGEIWLRGPVVCDGYWRRDDQAHLFDATTAGGEGGFLRTGDLGAMYEGELYVQGRLKDMLIVHGRNLYPHDMEQELRIHHPELGRVGAVFAVPGEADGVATQAVVVTHEIGKLPPERWSSLAGELRLTVTREFGVRVAVVALLRPGTVRRTTSGKVQRAAMSELFRTGRLSPIFQDPPADDRSPSMA
uniref:fatty acyl-AMP ligase n=1 Tax=Paractinoplanes polyasparticus TaxID=2856853 RepID=UPI001C84CF11|nr:fatty acyl-AMP ligase [Actinoplanes polyasparticus]